MRPQPALLLVVLLCGCGDPPPLVDPDAADAADAAIAAQPVAPDHDAAIGRAQRAAREAYGSRVVATPLSVERAALVAPGETTGHDGWSVVFALAPVAAPPALVVEAPAPAAGGLPAHAHLPVPPAGSARAADPPRESREAAPERVLVRVRDDGRVQVLPLAR
ncbi:MAG TPA: hypothetical protein VEL07_00545 [Planctomycetota bacterium]|nr:hypothetical protein [Planctomycetota bacterium]